MSKLVSFVLPAYKARFLKQALDSILLQTYKDFDLIVVNDASPEDIDSIIMSYTDPRIKYYKNKTNVGGQNLVKQWNYSISLCNSEYFVLASDDDVYDSMYLEKMLALAKKYPDVNILRPRVQLIDAQNNIYKVESYLNERTSVWEFVYSLHSHYIFGGVPFYMFKKSKWEEIGGFIDFPVAWCSDDATAISLAKEYDMVISNEILFSFRMSGENITTQKNNKPKLHQKIQARILYYEFLNQILIKAVPQGQRDAFYLTSLKNNLKTTMLRSIYELLCDSTLLACIMSIRKLLRIPFVTSKWLLICCIKRCGQVILGY